MSLYCRYASVLMARRHYLRSTPSLSRRRGVKNYCVRTPMHYSRVSLNGVSCKEKVAEPCLMRVDSMVVDKTPIKNLSGIELLFGNCVSLSHNRRDDNKTIYLSGLSVYFLTSQWTCCMHNLPTELADWLTPWNRFNFGQILFCSARKDNSSILRNSKSHYHIQKIPSLVSVLCQMSPLHTLPSCFLKIRFSCILHWPPVVFTLSFTESSLILWVIQRPYIHKN